MADATLPQDNSTTEAGTWQMLKLRDLGDGTVSLAASDLGGWDTTHIASLATTVVKTGAGILGGIVVNRAVALSTITIYDNTAASGTIIGIISQSASLLESQFALMYRCKVANGITVTTTSTDDITVLYL